MSSIVDYIVQHFGDLVNDSIFCVIGVVLGIVFAPKQNDNVSKQVFQETVHHFSERVIIRERHHYRSNNSRSQSDDTGILGISFFAAVLSAFLYVKYHDLIMQILTSLILVGVSSTFTIAYRLARHGAHHSLTTRWTATLLFVWIGGFAIVYEMGQQKITSIPTNNLNEFIAAVGLEGILSFSYDLIGVAFMILSMFIGFILLLHMFALNSYTVNKGQIASIVLRKTSFFIKKSNTSMISIVFLCVVSYLFTSGILANLVSQNTTNTVNLLQQQK